MYFGPEDPDFSSPRAVDTTPVHRTSRRLRGLEPEFGLLAPPVRSVMTSTASQTSETAGVALPFVLHAPRTPKSFHGDRFEDVEDWLDTFERVASLNEWDDRRKLRNVYFALEDPAKTWFENHESRLDTWQAFRRELLATYRSSERKERAEIALQSRVQGPNESVTMFVEDMCRLFRRSDPNMPEDKKVRHLMRGVKEQLFAGLVRNPPVSVAEFMKEAAAMERALQQRSMQYGRPSHPLDLNCQAITSGNPDEFSLRQLIRAIVREELELQRTQVVGHQRSAASFTDAVREEIRQVLQPTPVPEITVAPNYEVTAPQVMAYSDVLRRPAIGRQTFQSSTPARQQWSTSSASRHDHGQSARKAVIWRTGDNRPLCYHCGEAGHVLRHCPYRRMGLRGFSPDAPRPRYGERPPEVQEYLAANLLPPSPPPQRRQSRSPPPRRFTSPRRPLSTPISDTDETSSGPRRGN